MSKSLGSVEMCERCGREKVLTDANSPGAWYWWCMECPSATNVDAPSLPCTCSVQHDATMRYFVRHCPLHAAAPSLLEALKEAICWFGTGGSAEKAGCKCETMTDARDKALDAIAKAEGRS